MLKKSVLGLLRVGISAIILVLIVRQHGIRASSLWDMVRRMPARWVGLAVATYLASSFVGTFRWLILMRAQGIRIGFWRLLALNYIGFFFNNFMIGLTGGDVVKGFYASRMTPHGAEAVASMVADRITGILGLIAMVPLGLLAGAWEPEIRQAAGVVGLFVVIFVVLVCLVFSRRAVRKVGRAADMVNQMGARRGNSRFGQLVALVRDRARRFHKALILYRSRRAVAAWAMLASIGVWVLIVVMNWQIGRGLGINVGIKYFFIFIPVINIIANIPITISGWGLREDAYTRFFGGIGIAPQQAFTMSIFYAMTMLVTSMGGAILYLLRIPRCPVHRRTEGIATRIP